MATPQQQQGPVPPHPNAPSKPQQIAQTMADFVRSGLLIVFWLVVAAAGLGAAYIALHAVMWAINLSRSALGL